MENDILIACPSCGHQFSVDDALTGQLEHKLKKEMDAQLQQHLIRLKAQEEALELERKKMAEYKENERAIFEKKLQSSVQEELVKKQVEIQQKEREKVTAELELLKKENEAKKEENLALKKREIEILQKEKELREQKENMQLEMQKNFLEKSRELEEKARKAGREELEMKLKEMEVKAEQQNKLIEEMKRKSEQGSMQLQGEALELVLEELLRSTFPFDKIAEVGKGVKGADVTHTVMNAVGQPCGTILYETKRTKAFSMEWIDKLKQDLRSQKADIAVIVTDMMPKDMDCFGPKNGVFICSFKDVKGLALILRDSILRISQAMASQENKGDKMHMLYDYLTSNEFSQQMGAIVEAFTSLKEGIGRERISMERMWKEREKQLERVLINTSGMYGSIKGIAGSAVSSIKLLELPGEDEEHSANGNGLF